MCGLGIGMHRALHLLALCLAIIALCMPGCDARHSRSSLQARVLAAAPIVPQLDDRSTEALRRIFLFEYGCHNITSDRANMINGETGFTCFGLSPSVGWQERKWFPVCNNCTNPLNFLKCCWEKDHDGFQEMAAELYLSTSIPLACSKLQWPAWFVCADIVVNLGSARALAYIKELGCEMLEPVDCCRRMNEKHKKMHERVANADPEQGIFIPVWVQRYNFRKRVCDTGRLPEESGWSGPSEGTGKDHPADHPTPAKPPAGSPKIPGDDTGPPKPPAGDDNGPKPPAGNIGPPKPPAGNIGPPKPPAGNIGPPKPPAGNVVPPKPPAGDIGPPKPPAGNVVPPKPPAGNIGPPKPPAGNIGPPKPPAGNIGPPKPPAGDTGPKPPGDDTGPPKPPAPPTNPTPSKPQSTLKNNANTDPATLKTLSKDGTLGAVCHCHMGSKYNALGPKTACDSLFRGLFPEAVCNFCVSWCKTRFAWRKATCDQNAITFHCQPPFDKYDKQYKRAMQFWEEPPNLLPEGSAFVELEERFYS